MVYDKIYVFIIININITSISVCAIWQAAPRPTAKGVGTVPLLIPLSCPPPLWIASTRTLGLLLTYKAPTPKKFHYIL